jgi:DNA-binding transcriptional ArsR family regulator
VRIRGIVYGMSMVESIQTLERTLKALANKRRLAIIKFLRKEREATVGDIAEHIQLSFKSTSRHLHVLAVADILVSEQRSLYIYYSINPSIRRSIKNIIVGL